MRTRGCFWLKKTPLDNIICRWAHTTNTSFGIKITVGCFWLTTNLATLIPQSLTHLEDCPIYRGPDHNYETEQSILSYTSKAQPSSWIHSDLPESPQTFIYGKGDIPVASIVNAEGDEVAFTSFEEPGFDGEKSNGNWLLEGSGGGNNSLSRTGNYSKDLNSSRRCSTTVANGKKYRLSFWTQNSESSYVITVNGQSNLHDFVLGQDGENGWKYVEFEIDLSGSSGTSLIVLKGNTGNNYTDELRLYPVDAQMSTVCYDSSRRVISQTDPTGRTSTYEYDDLGRLVIVRDESGNIISRQTYNFGNN